MEACYRRLVEFSTYMYILVSYISAIYLGLCENTYSRSWLLSDPLIPLSIRFPSTIINLPFRTFDLWLGYRSIQTYHIISEGKNQLH